MKDKLDKLLNSFFYSKKAVIKIPKIPEKIIPVYKSSPRFVFSISFILIVAFCSVAFILFTFLAVDQMNPLAVACNNFIEEYSLGERIKEGVFYLQDSFVRNRSF